MRAMRARGSLLVLCAALPACLIDIDPSLADKKAAAAADAGTRDPGPAAGGATSATEGDAGAASSSGDASAAVPADLVGSWSFEEPTGQIALDASRRGHDGTIAPGVARAAGKQGAGLSFNGGAPMFSVASLDGTQFPARGTLVFWFKPATPVQTSARLFDARGTGSRSNLFIEATSDVAVSAGLQDPGQFDLISVNRSASSDGWSRVALVWSRSGGTLTVDRLSDSLLATGSFVPSGQSFRMGAGFTGSIDEVRLYDRPLGPAEIGALP
jgi:hypothetical protein